VFLVHSIQQWSLVHLVARWRVACRDTAVFFEAWEVLEYSD
jgi:hypothetical protein